MRTPLVWNRGVQSYEDLCGLTQSGAVLRIQLTRFAQMRANAKAAGKLRRVSCLHFGETHAHHPHLNMAPPQDPRARS